jgi:hypothetical protein
MDESFSRAGWSTSSGYGAHRGRLSRILAAQNRPPPDKNKKPVKEDIPFATDRETGSKYSIESPMYKVAKQSQSFRAHQFKKGQSGNPSGSSLKARLRAAEKRRQKRHARAAAKLARQTIKASQPRNSNGTFTSNDDTR